MHYVDGKGVGILLGLARIGRRHQRARRENQRAGARDIAEQQADQERGAAVVDQLAHVIAMFQMTELVREDAGDLVGIFRLRQ